MHIAQAFLVLRESLPSDEAVLRRLDRGYDIVRKRGYEISKFNDQTWKVHKASTSLLEDTSAVYYVDDKECSCPDYQQAPAGLCKHRLAIKLLVLMEGK